MDPATLALIASALGPALVTVLTKLAEKGIVEPALEPLTDWLKARTTAAYNTKHDEEKLRGLIGNTLTALAFGPEQYARWSPAFKLLHNDSGLAARVAAATVEMTADRPELIPPELLRELKLEEGERPALARWLFALRKELAGMAGFSAGIQYANELHALHRLDGLYELTAGLAATVVDGEGGKALRVQIALPDMRALEAPYLKDVMNEFAGVPLEGRSTDDTLRADDELRLERVYIALNTTESRQVRLEEKERVHSITLESSGRTSGEKHVSALRAITESRRLLVLGDPGSGKSTLAQHLCLCLAGARLDPASDWPRRLQARDVDQWPLAFYPLPIFIRLRLFASATDCLPADPQQMGQAKHLWAYLQKTLTEPGLANGVDRVLTLLTEGQALVVFDGLDEVADPARRVMVAQAIGDFAFKRFPHARVLVTCRVKQYPLDARQRPSAAWKLPGFPTVTLADFDPEQIKTFVESWFAELHDRGRLPDPDERTRSLLTAFEARPELGRDLAPKPILLTQMALIHAHSRLPDSRIDVYKECAKLLLWDWERLRARQSRRQGEAAEDYLLSLNIPGLRLSEVEDALDKAVFQAHEQGAADIPTDLLRRALRQMFQEQYGVAAPLAAGSAEAVIEGWLRGRNGLLLPEGEHSFNVPHRSFREFMVARHLYENTLVNPETGDDEKWAFSGPRLAKVNGDQWREVMRFAAGLASLPDVPTALNELCPEAVSVDPASVLGLILAGEIARDVGAGNLRAKGGKLGKQVAARLEQQLLHLMRDTAEGPPAYPDDKPLLTSPNLLPPQTRLTAGLLLDSLGWTPPDLYAFVKVENADYWDERIKTGSPRNQPTKSVNPGNPLFFISRFLVTNLQYQRFLDDDKHYADPTLWQSIVAFDADGQLQKDMGAEAWEWFQQNGGKDRKPVYWDDARFGATHRLLPVVGVTWYEAAAYCAWLNRHPPTGFALPPGWGFRLPTETEWLTAAGDIWKDKAIEEKTPRYPWQKTPANVTEEEIVKYANTNSSNLNGTSPVGMYPAGASPLGLMDMGGNVWEWQANLFEKDENSRAVRGGSWDFINVLARAAARYGNHPGLDWDSNVGVRVVAAPG